MSTQTTPQSSDFARVLGRVLRAPVRLQTYRNLVYLAALFPLGIVYFTLLTAGFATGIPLVIVVVGIPILVVLLAVVVALAGFERTLARVLLGVEIPVSSVESGKSLRGRIEQLATDLRTWKAVAYLLSVFVFGSVTFGLLSSLLATAGSFLLAPVYYQRASVDAFGPIPSGEFTLDVLFGWDNLLVGLTTTFRFGSWQIETLLGALLVAGLGAVLLLIALQLVNGLAWAWGRYARFMLTTPRYWNAR